jgi:hypothetical protein
LYASDSDEDFSPETASDSESDTESEGDSDASGDGVDLEMGPELPEVSSRQRTLIDSWKLDPQQVFAVSPDGDKRIGIRELRAVLAAGGSWSGLPSWLGYRGKGRPDGVIIQGCLRGTAKGPPPTPAEKKKIRVHLIEFTRTSEAYWDESEKAKVLQHEKVVKAVTNAGFQCQLHIIQMGVRGGVPVTFIERLKALGLTREDAIALSAKLSISSATAGVKAWWTRRALCASGSRSKRRGGTTTRAAVRMPGVSTVVPFNAQATLRKAESRAAALERETRARKGSD